MTGNAESVLLGKRRVCLILVRLNSMQPAINRVSNGSIEITKNAVAKKLANHLCKAFMTEKIQHLREKYKEASTFKFGDSKTLCDQLLKLVREGKKTATCGALSDYTEGGKTIPVVGRRDIALEWDGTPALVIETIYVEQKRFCDVDEAFALKEGENESLEGWRSDHQIYFERTGIFDKEMMLLCEEFKLVEDVKNLPSDKQDKL